MKSLQTGSFLKQRRTSLDPDARALGSHRRLATRYGKRVTQEEVAEAVGVSRVWYATLESGAAVPTSPRLLDGLAGALMLNQSERTTLFRLALPELKLGREAASVVESLGQMRAVARKLWNATSETEALAIASMKLAEWFDDAALVTELRRRSPGTWDWSYAVDRGQGERVTKTWKELASALTPAQIDSCFLFPLLAEPGDVGSTDDAPHPAALKLLEAFRRRDPLEVASFIAGRVRTRRGAVAGLHVTHNRPRAYSEADYAVVGTLAELTSLALA